MFLRHRSGESVSRGQGLVEFALMLPILAVLLVMAIDFGRVFFGSVAVNNAARIGADIAAGQAESWPANNSGEQANQDYYRDALVGDLTPLNCTPPDGGTWDRNDVPDPVFVDVDGDGDARDDGDHAVVTLRCSFRLLTPLAGSILGGTVSVGAEAAFPVNYEVTADVPSLRPLPTPTPVPTPTPGPEICTIPNYVTLRANDAENLWDASDFTGSFTRSGSGNFVIASQSLVPPGAEAPCTSSILVSSGTAPTPAPTPSGAAPTATPAPLCARPNANFIAEPPSGVKPLTVQFTDTSTAPSECPILSWTWDFDDGSAIDTRQHPSHVFTFQGQGQPRSYDVTLMVANLAGVSNPRTVTITVSP
ncbi:MAG: PKD domain-containing protein [Chloroflexota bacterium]|nr:PKD domain-containing protein [Chloroflexota bacterium]